LKNRGLSGAHRQATSIGRFIDVLPASPTRRSPIVTALLDRAGTLQQLLQGAPRHGRMFVSSGRLGNCRLLLMVFARTVR
jgi:hypothetical protein